jgi:ribosomal protein L9
MPNGSIKELGEHEIQIILHSQVRQSLKVVVTAEQVEDSEGVQEEIIS